MHSLINRRAALALIGGMAACGVHAGNLQPGDVVIINTGTTLAEQPSLAGTVVEQRSTRFHYQGWFQITNIDGSVERRTGNVKGTVLSQVVLANDGTYDFYWQVQLSKQSFLPVAGFSLDGFGAGDFNVGWRSDAAGAVSPSFADSTDGRITFHFGQYLPPSTEIYPGQQTYFFFIDTRAHAYARNGSFSLLSERDSGGSMMLDWGGASGNMAAFAPVLATGQGLQPPAVPEPATAALSLAGLGLLGLARRRQGGFRRWARARDAAASAAA